MPVCELFGTACLTHTRVWPPRLQAVAILRQAQQGLGGLDAREVLRHVCEGTIKGEVALLLGERLVRVRGMDVYEDIDKARTGEAMVLSAGFCTYRSWVASSAPTLCCGKLAPLRQERPTQAH